MGSAMAKNFNRVWGDAADLERQWLRQIEETNEQSSGNDLKSRVQDGGSGSAACASGRFISTG
jgi:hypothetical protein